MSKIPIITRPVIPNNPPRIQRGVKNDNIAQKDDQFDVELNSQIQSENIAAKENTLPNVNALEDDNISNSETIDASDVLELGFDEVSLGKMRLHYEASKRLKTLAQKVLEYLNYSTTAQEAANVINDLAIGNELAAKRMAQNEGLKND